MPRVYDRTSPSHTTNRRRPKPWLACLAVSATMLAASPSLAAPAKQVPVSMSRLQQQAATSLEQMDYKQVALSARQLLSAATRADDQRMQAWARLYLGNAELMNGNKDKALRLLRQADQMGEQLKNDTIRSLALNAIAIYEASTNMNLYVAQHYFLTSLEIADRCHYERHKGTVYANLSIIARSGRDSTGIVYANKCYEFGIEHERPHLVYQGAFNIAAFHHMAGRDDEALRYIAAALNVEQQHGYTPDPSLYELCSDIYADRLQFDKAEDYIRQALDVAQRSTSGLLSEIYYQYARVRHRQKRYQESIDYLQQALKAAEDQQVFTSVVDILDLLAQNYEAMGDSRMALRYLRQSRDSSYALSISDRQHLTAERQMVFYAMKQEQETVLREQQLSSQRKINAFLSILLLLLVLLFVVTIRYMQRRNQLYRNIVQQNIDAISRERDLTQRIPTPHQPDSQTAEPPRRATIDEQKSQQLYEQLCMLMEERQVFRDNQLGRENLADMLGTNRTYLSQVIAEHTNMNFAQYINNYRIREAVRILSDRQQLDYPLKQLCADLGFSSLSNFYKLFQKSVGMSPSAYRKSLPD